MLDANGQPVRRVHVEVFVSNDTVNSATTGEDGQFTLFIADAESWKLKAGSSGRGRTSAEGHGHGSE